MKFFAVVFTLLNFFLLASALPNRSPDTGLCEQCNPSPPLNRCDTTTSCINVRPDGNYHCACR